MKTFKPAFVLVHGGWHNKSTWNKVAPLLEEQGFSVLSLDLPGAGVHAIAPSSVHTQPFDSAAFAAEPSASAGITQVQRTQAVVDLVRQAALSCDGQIILVGHSAGGMTVSAVAEQVPELLGAVVYISGFLVPEGSSLLEMLQHASLSSATSPRLFVGNPVAIGATRIHAGSADESYRALLKKSFYDDVSESDFDQISAQLHWDEPNAGALAPSPITAGRFGSVARHYIRCTQDRAIPLTGQDHMIDSVDSALGSKTKTHTLHSSHSPFLSQPAALSKILVAIAVESVRERHTARCQESDI